MEKITTVGLDLAKQVMAVHGERGRRDGSCCARCCGVISY